MSVRSRAGPGAAVYTSIVFNNRRAFHVFIGCLVLAAVAPNCGGSLPTQCATGASIACVGPGGCNGYQVCQNDGSYNACICGADVDGGQDSASDTGQTIDATADAPATNDAPTDDAPTFDVNAISGVAVWLIGDAPSSITVTNGHVSKWADQTTHHNDAAGSTTDATLNPTVKASAINGLEAIHFDQGTGSTGNALAIIDNADTSLQWGADDFYVAMVVAFDNDATKAENLGVGTFYSKRSGVSGLLFYGNVPITSSTPQQVGITLATAWVDSDSEWGGGAQNTGAAHLFCGRRRSGYLDILIDGVLQVTGSGNNYDIGNAGVLTQIGGEADATVHRLDGDIGEIVAVKGVLSSSDETSLEGYLKDKWATP